MTSQITPLGWMRNFLPVGYCPHSPTKHTGIFSFAMVSFIFIKAGNGPTFHSQQPAIIMVYTYWFVRLNVPKGIINFVKLLILGANTCQWNISASRTDCLPIRSLINLKVYECYFVPEDCAVASVYRPKCPFHIIRTLNGYLFAFLFAFTFFVIIFVCLFVCMFVCWLLAFF